MNKSELMARLLLVGFRLRYNCKRSYDLKDIRIYVSDTSKYVSLRNKIYHKEYTHDYKEVYDDIITHLQEKPNKSNT